MTQDEIRHQQRTRLMALVTEEEIDRTLFLGEPVGWMKDEPELAIRLAAYAIQMSHRQAAEERRTRVLLEAIREQRP